jgi:hypothetical protein
VPAFWAALERALAEFLPDPAPATAAVRTGDLPTIPVAPRPAGGPAG